MVHPAARAVARWREWLLTLAAIEAVAVALWLVPASVHIVQWPASGPVRLALMAPAWQLAAWLVGAGVVGLLFVLSPLHDRWSTVLRPFLLLWLLTLPYLPWLADRVPLLLILAGPLRWLLVGVAALRGALSIASFRAAVQAPLTMNRRAVFSVSLALYVALGLYSVTTNGLGGDEPHYLVITESLLRDGDLQIGNNHVRGDYRSFFRGELRPDFMQRGTNGQIYSIHAPGLPALLLPAYAVAGHLGAVVFLCLIAALTARAIFDLAERLAGRQAAVLTWAAVCVTVPFVPYSWSVFPEMPGALLVAWGALWLWQAGEGPGAARWALRGLALALLPWLHTKFIVFLAMFSVGFALRLMRRPTRLVALGTPIAVSCALWLYSFNAIYGSWNPEAPYGAYTRIYVLTRNIPHGLVGLFFDQKFGLLVFSPIYVMVAVGVWLAARQRSSWLAAALLIVTTVAFVGSTARLYMFWGGSSAPARFFVPVLPCLAPFVALAVERARSSVARAMVGLVLTIGLGSAAVGLFDPSRLMLYSEPHGRSRLLEWVQAGSPLALAAPTFTEPTWASDLAPLGLWLVAAALSAAVALLIWRRTKWTSWRAAGAIASAFLLTAGLLTARPSAAVREATARRGDLDVLWRFDGERLRTFDYATFSRPTPDRLRDLTTVRLRDPRPSGRVGALELGPLQLPPGRFDAEIWFNAARPREGQALVDEPRATFGRIDGQLDNPAVFSVDVPAPTRRAMVRVPDPQVAAAVTEVRLVPRSIVPPSARDLRPARLIESVPGRPGGYLVYTDGEAYPELGTFWTRGTASTTVMVAPGGASRLVLTLFTGPNAGTVSISVGGQSRQVGSVADESQTVAFDLQPGERLVPLTISSSVMFRPSEVNSASSDSRGLGCQVHVALE